MPRLPDFASLGQTPAPQTPLSIARVETQPLEFNVRQGPGEAAIRGGRDVAAAGIQMQDHIDTLRAEDAYNQLIQKRTELEVSPDNGFVNVNGSAAIDSKFYNDYNRRFVDAATGIEGGLSTDNQKQLFRNRAAVASAQYQSSLMQHMSQQTSAFADNTEKTTVKLEVDNASNAPNDAAFDTSLTRIRGILESRGSRLHQPPAQIEEAKREAVGAAWKDRIRVTMNNDPLAAQAMYNANRDAILPDDKVVIEHQLHQTVLPVQAKNLAYSIIGGAKSDTIEKAFSLRGEAALNGLIQEEAVVDSSGLGTQPSPATKVTTKANLGQWLSDAETAADKIRPNDPVFKDLVVQNVKGYVSNIVAAQDATAKLAHSVLMGAALGSEGRKPLTMSELLSTAETRQAWVILSDGAQRGIMGLIRQNEHEATTGRPMRTNPAIFDDLFHRIHLPPEDPNAIRSWTSLAPYLARGVNRTDYDWLKKEIDQQQTDDGRKLTTTRENYLRGIKGQFSTSSMMNVDAQGDERFNNFRTFVLSEEAKAQASGGKINAYDLYNYKSPLYISNKIPSFQASLDEQIRHLSDRLRQTAPPAKGAGPVTSAPQMTATNPTTNEKLISNDGGRTWQKP